jgi:hypothetical protein
MLRVIIAPLNALKQFWKKRSKLFVPKIYQSPFESYQVFNFEAPSNVHHKNQDK